jgi:hypothetical protein
MGVDHDIFRVGKSNGFGTGVGGKWWKFWPESRGKKSSLDIMRGRLLGNAQIIQQNLSALFHQE